MTEARQVGDECAAELAFDVAIEKFALEVAKDPVAMDRVIGGDDAASRHGIDDVDLIEQPPGPSADLECDVAQRLQRSIRQRRRSGAAPRERDNDQHVARIVRIGLYPLQAIALRHVLALGGRVDRIVRIAAGNHCKRAEQAELSRPAHAECRAECSEHGGEWLRVNRAASIPPPLASFLLSSAAAALSDSATDQLPPPGFSASLKNPPSR